MRAVPAAAGFNQVETDQLRGDGEHERCLALAAVEVESGLQEILHLRILRGAFGR